MRRLSRFLALTSLSLLVALPAAAQQIRTDVSVDELAEMMRREGFSPEVNNRDPNHPRINFESGGRKSIIYLQSCNNGRCRNMYLYGGFKMDRAPTVQTINDWNRERRFSRAYIDKEGDPVLENDFDFDGGATFGGVREWLKTWQDTLGKYAKHVGFGHASAD